MFGNRSVKKTYVKIKREKYYNDFERIGNIEDVPSGNAVSYLVLDDFIDDRVLKKDQNTLATAKITLYYSYGNQLAWCCPFDFVIGKKKHDQYPEFDTIINKCASMLYDINLFNYVSEAIIIIVKIMRDVCNDRYPCTHDFLCSFLATDGGETLSCLIKMARKTLLSNIQSMPQFEENELIKLMQNVHYYGNLFFQNCKLDVNWNVFNDPCMSAAIFKTAPLLSDAPSTLKHWVSYCARLKNEQFRQTVIKLISNDPKIQHFIKTIILDVLSEQPRYVWQSCVSHSNLYTYQWNQESITVTNLRKNEKEAKMSYINCYEKTFVYKTSTKKTRRKVKNFFKHNNDLNYLSITKLFIPQCIEKCKFAGPISVQLLNTILVKSLSIEQQRIYGVLESYYSTEYNLPTQYPLATVITCLSTQDFAFIVTKLDEYFDFAFNVTRYATAHRVLHEFGVLLFNFSRLDNVTTPIDWFQYIGNAFGLSRFILFLNPICKNVTYIWLFLDRMYSAKKQGVYSAMNNDNILTMGEALVHFSGSKEKAKQFLRFVRDCYGYETDFTISSKHLHPALQKIQQTIEPKKWNDKDVDYSEFKIICSDTLIFVNKTDVKDEKEENDTTIHQKTKSIPKLNTNNHDNVDVTAKQDDNHTDKSESNNENDDSDYSNEASDSSSKSESNNENDDSNVINDSDDTDESSHNSNDIEANVLVNKKRNNTDTKPDAKNTRINNLFLQIQRNKQILPDNYDGMLDVQSLFVPSEWDAMSACTAITTRTQQTIYVKRDSLPTGLQRDNEYKSNDVIRMHSENKQSFPMIDIDNIHYDLIHQPKVDENKESPEWITQHNMNATFVESEMWLPYYWQYNLAPTSPHDQNRSWSKMSMWRTGTLHKNESFIYSGIFGYFNNYYNYLTQWSNDLRHYLMVRDGILKTTNCDWFNMINETFNQHINIIDVYWCPLEFETAYTQKNLYLESTFLHPVKLKDDTIDPYVENKKIYDTQEEEVHTRKLTVQSSILDLLMVCLCIIFVVCSQLS